MSWWDDDLDVGDAPLPTALGRGSSVFGDVDLGNFWEQDADWQEPSSPAQQQEALLSRRARIRQQILEDDARAGRNQGGDSLNFGERVLLGFGEGTFSGLSGLGEAVAAVTPEFVGKDFGTLSRRARKKAATFQLDDKEEGFDLGDFGQVLGAGVASLIPTVLGGLAGGFPLALAAGAIQQGGSTYQAARDRFIKDGQDEKNASWRALPIGVLSGAITGLVTRGFGNTGAEAIRRGLTAGGLKQSFKAIAKDIGLEAAEENVDQLAQGALEMMAFNPEKTVQEILNEAVIAGAAGGIIGGGVGGLRETAARLAKRLEGKPQPQGPRDQRTMEQAVPFEQRNADLPPYMEEVFFRPEDVSYEQAGPTGEAQTEQPPIDIPGAPPRPAHEPKPWQQRFDPSKVTTDQAGRDFLNIRRDVIRELVADGLLSVDEANDIGRGSDPTRAAVFNLLSQRLEALGLSGVTAGGKVMTVDTLRGFRPAPQPEPAAETFDQDPVIDPEPVNFAPMLSRRARSQNYATETIVEPQGRVTQYPQIAPGRPLPAPGGGNRALNVPASTPETQVGGERTNGQKERLQEGSQEGQGLLTPAPTLTPAPVVTPTPQVPTAPPVQIPTIEQPPGKKVKAGKIVHDDKIALFRSEVGQIRGKKQMGAGSEGSYGALYEDAIRKNALKPLFTNAPGKGRAPDDALGAAKELGIVGPDAGFDELLEVLIREANARQGSKVAAKQEAEELSKQEKKRQEFESLAIENKRNAAAKARSKKEAIPVDSLIVGDELKIGGEPFTVTEILVTEDDRIDFVMLNDGRRFGVQSVMGGQVIYPDAGTYKPAEVEFLPPEESAITTEETVRLRELIAKPKLTAAEADERAALEQKAGQQTLPGVENTPRRIETPEEAEAPARRAEIAKRQGQRLGGADLRTQQGLFEPTREELDVPLFNQRQASIAPPAGEPLPGEVDSAQGTEAIRALIEGSNLPPAAKQVVMAFLDQPVMRELDWSGLVVELKSYIEGGASGTRLGNLIELTRNLDSTTFPHEVAHILFDFLPADYKQAISQARLQSIDQFQFRDFADLLKPGTMTSDEFREQIMTPLRERGVSDSIIALMYRHINDSEFLAHFVGEKFSKSAFVDRNGRSVWKKIRDWFQGLMDAVRRVVGATPDMERIYREMLAGTHKVDLRAAEEFESRQATYSFDASEAANAARLAKGPNERQIEADHQLAQAFDIVEFMNKYGAATMQWATQKMLRYADYVGIRMVGEQLNNGVGESYRQIKRRLQGWRTITGPNGTQIQIQQGPVDQYKLNWIARFAGQQIVALEATLKDAIAKADAGFKEITGKGFIRKLAKLAKAKQEKVTAEMVNRVSTAMFNTAFEKATKALQEEALSDIQIARIKAQLDGIDAARKSSSAMSQLVRDMISKLMSTPAGVQLINDPNFGTRTDIADVYKDITRSTGGTLRDDGLISWATFIIQKNKELRDTLIAAYYSQQSGIRNQMNAYETKFMADLEKNPIKTIRREMREAQKRTSEYEQARFAWMTLNQEVTDQLNKYLILQDAATVATGILNDPDWKAFKAEVFKDGQYYGTQKPLEPFTDKTVVLPDGRELDVDTQKVVGSKTEFNRVRNSYEKAIADLHTWLADPANQNDPNYAVHERNLNTITQYFYGLSVLRPSDNVGAWDLSMYMIKNAIGAAGGRVAGQAKRAMASWNRLKVKAAWWNQGWSEKITQARIKALRSHGLNPRKIVEANNEWWEKIGNQLAYSMNRQGGGLKVGDQVGSGWIVTAEDMADLELQAQATQEGFGILREHERDFPEQVQTTMDTLGGATAFRRALQGAENMLTRLFNYDLREAFAGPFVDAFKAKDKARMIGLLNQFWNRLGYSFVWDRNADFARETFFDGRNGPLDLIAQRMARDQNYVRSFDELVSEVAALSSEPEAEVEAILLAEFGRITNGWFAEAKDETEGVFDLPRGEEARNATSRSRNKALAPFAFYSYGFKNVTSIAAFAGKLHSRALDRMIAGLSAIIADLDRQKGEFETTANAIGRKAATDKNRLERANGESFDNWRNLSRRRKIVADVVEALKTYDPDQDVDASFRRTVGAVTGLLISGIVTTARNFTMGPRYIGWIANQINSAPLVNNPAAAWYVWMDMTLARLAPSFVYGVAKSAVQFSFIDAWKAAAQLVFEPNRSAGKFFNTAFRNVIMELGHNVYDRIEYIRDMKAKGLLFIPDYVREFDNRTLGSMMYQGKLQTSELSGTQKALQFPAALMETILMLTKTFAPTLGDVALNAATDKFFNSSISPVNMVEKRLRELFTEWQNSKYRLFNFSNPRDPVNLFSSKELFPRTPYRWFPTSADIEKVRSQFADAGLNFDEKAIEFMAQLDAGNPQAVFLSRDERNVLNQHFMEYVNRSSPVATPLNLREQNFLNNLISPFMFWKARMFSNFVKQLTVPAQVEGGARNTKELVQARAMQWAAVMTTVLLPLLLASAAFSPLEEEMARVLKRLLHNQEANTRQPWEKDGARSHAIGWGIGAVNGVPFLDMAVNAALNDLPNRASLDPSLVIVEKAKDMARYMGGVAQTGDPFFRLPEVIGSFVPDVKIVLNRLESEEGKRDSANALAVIRRKAPMEMLRPPFGGATGPSYTELSPYGPAMENAAMRGDVQEVVRLHQEATAKAAEMGRADPEKAATAIFQARNPYDRALRQKMTEGQRQQFLARLSRRERALVENMEQRFEVAADAIGANFRPAKEEPLLASGFRMPTLSRRGRGGPFRGRISGVRSRGRIGRTRRSRLRRSSGLSRRARRR